MLAPIDGRQGGIGPARTSDRVPAGPAELFWQVRPGSYRADVDADAWPVGFSPTGEALPDALTDVLLRGSHWVRSAQRAEAERRERSAAIATHVEAQLATFLRLCAEAELMPPVTMRVVRDVPRLAGARHRAEGRPRAALRTADDLAIPLGLVDPAGAARSATDSPADQPADPPDRPRPSDRNPGLRRSRRSPGNPPRGADRHDRRPPAGGPPSHWHGRSQLTAWPLLYWRCESFPSAGRSLHLFVEPGGRTFEGRDLPAPLTVVGRQVRVWPVDAPSIVEGMAEVDARRCALHLVDGMARLLWRAGIGL
ncbi:MULTISPECIES: hypothetical protein [unclassified Pseudofrankia]|uniref:hypothetical protein n=1 Tax=unclassified Pseudofrankia TaxID=2994372 RepID=UPI001F527328|nr:MULTISPECIES: hypothetical protein [unclassified Pseudofrankia]MDT3443479.1 hypothetical protein [Pseudofrankia sp. BMG5.37]